MCIFELRSRDCLKNLYLYFHKLYSYKTCKGADFREEIQHANA